VTNEWGNTRGSKLDILAQESDLTRIQEQGSRYLILVKWIENLVRQRHLQWCHTLLAASSHQLVDWRGSWHSFKTYRQWSSPSLTLTWQSSVLVNGGLHSLIEKVQSQWWVSTNLRMASLNANLSIDHNLHKHNFTLTISCQNQRHAKPKIIKDKKLSLKFDATLAERWKEPNTTSSASATTSTFASFFSDKNFSRTCKSSHWVISSCVKLCYYYLSCFTHSVASIG
jgi:hypothetical protein